MRKYIIVCLALVLGLLSGCRGDLYAIYRDVERLRPVQTLGIDRSAGRIVVSAAGIDPAGGAPLALCEAGESIDRALVGLQNAFPEAEPYYAHVEYIVLGREAAEEGILPWLEWLERNPQMRLDTVIFVAQGTAAELVLGASGQDIGTSDRLESLQREVESLGEGQVFTVRELASALAERRAGLCGFIRAGDQSSLVKNSDSLSVLPAGFAVFKEDRLVDVLGADQVPGVLLLHNRPQGARILIETEDAGLVTLLLDSGRSKVTREEDRVQIDATLYASLLEMEGCTDPNLEALNRALAETACGWLEELVRRQQHLDCDFLGITDGDSPAALEFEIRVLADVERSYDLRESEGQT